MEPFFGSGAVLFARPQPFEGTETVNDADGYVANFWRALKHDAEAVAVHADNPVNECDLHARHCWLLEHGGEKFVARLMGDPDFFDAKVAGWWVWGLCCWIGSGWCSGKGPWGVDVVDGVRQLVHLGNAGRGVNRQRVESLIEYLGAFAERLERVRVCCGDWKRVCGPTPTVKLGLTGVFLDPPYADTANRDADLYRQDSLSVAHEVREWAIAHGDDARLRIVLCGYDGEHAMPADWTAVPWKAKGGYGSQGNGRGRKNASREVLWLSPHCLPVGDLLEAAA